jgi:hypothetical protein
MSYSASQSANGFHLLSLVELPLQKGSFGNVGDNTQGAGVLSFAIPQWTGADQSGQSAAIFSAKRGIVLLGDPLAATFQLFQRHGPTFLILESQQVPSQHLLHTVAKHGRHLLIDKSSQVLAVQDPNAFRHRFHNPVILLFTLPESFIQGKLLLGAPDISNVNS